MCYYYLSSIFYKYAQKTESKIVLPVKINDEIFIITPTSKGDLHLQLQN